jgi:8-hydroxy-5-deazaflavin:NADPH oxidoreductase
MSAKPVIAILGGTGDLGSGLAKRWIGVGHSIVIGSRSAEKARTFAKELGGDARGDDHVGAAKCTRFRRWKFTRVRRRWESR